MGGESAKEQSDESDVQIINNRAVENLDRQCIKTRRKCGREYQEGVRRQHAKKASFDDEVDGMTEYVMVPKPDGYDLIDNYVPSCSSESGEEGHGVESPSGAAGLSTILPDISVMENNQNQLQIPKQPQQCPSTSLDDSGTMSYLRSAQPDDGQEREVMPVLSPASTPTSISSPDSPTPQPVAITDSASEGELAHRNVDPDPTPQEHKQEKSRSRSMSVMFKSRCNGENRPAFFMLMLAGVLICGMVQMVLLAYICGRGSGSLGLGELRAGAGGGMDSDSNIISLGHTSKYIKPNDIVAGLLGMFGGSGRVKKESDAGTGTGTDALATPLPLEEPPASISDPLPMVATDSESSKQQLVEAGGGSGSGSGSSSSMPLPADTDSDTKNETGTYTDTNPSNRAGEETISTGEAEAESKSNGRANTMIRTSYKMWLWAAEKGKVYKEKGAEAYQSWAPWVQETWKQGSLPLADTVKATFHNLSSSVNSTVAKWKDLIARRSRGRDRAEADQGEGQGSKARSDGDKDRIAKEDALYRMVMELPTDEWREVIQFVRAKARVSAGQSAHEAQKEEEEEELAESKRAREVILQMVANKISEGEIAASGRSSHVPSTTTATSTSQHLRTKVSEAANLASHHAHQLGRRLGSVLDGFMLRLEGKGKGATEQEHEHEQAQAQQPVGMSGHVEEHDL